jgi:predicted transposase YdaD
MMRESVIFQEIEAEAEARGDMKGRIRGMIEEGQTLILRQLNRRFGSISPELQSQVQELSLELLEELSEDLLDFETGADLGRWLRSRPKTQNSSN